MGNHILSIEKTTDNRFLNMYDLHYENKLGEKKLYHDMVVTIVKEFAAVENMRM